MRVMLGAMKQAGWTDFDTCWSNAIQRIRVQPYMDEDEATELLEDKQRLVEAKPGFRRAFNGQNIGTDVFQGGTAENDSADSGIADH